MPNQCNYCCVEIPEQDVLCEECYNSRYMLEKYITKDEILNGTDENNPSFYQMDDDAQRFPKILIMKTKLTLIILAPLMLLGFNQLYSVIYKFNRMRKLYVDRFQYYKRRNLIKDSYCEYYIQAFGEFRLWMFKEFVFNKHYTVKHFFNSTYVYQNMNAHYIKESGDVPFMPEFNNIMEHWKLHSLKRGQKYPLYFLYLKVMTHTQTLIAETCDEIKELLLDKNRKYGDSAVNPIRILSKSSNTEQILVRIDDKLNRIKNAQSDEDEDVITDLIGYLVLYKVAKKFNNP